LWIPFGKISNHRQEPWKTPLPQFIEHLYLKRFGRERPQVVTPAEEWGRSAAAGKPVRNPEALRAALAQIPAAPPVQDHLPPHAEFRFQG
jgi:hypothetical protein